MIFSAADCFQNSHEPGHCRTFFLPALLLCLLAHFALSVNPLCAEGATVTIESAQKIEYRTVEKPAVSNAPDSQSDSQIILLTGDVNLSISNNGTKTTITADSITFNRERNLIYAKGNITLRQTGSGSDQNITADQILFNTETMEGIFDSARIDQSSSDSLNLPSGSSLEVSADLFAKGASDTITFKDGVLTFCDEETPHWQINASRIWLLPGTEFAFFNAVFSIHKFPVFYLPFFYYPKDELVFNPVFGYSPRNGYFTQTTTYLVGRKPLNSGSKSGSDAGSEITDFFKSNKLKEQYLDGLFLRNTEKDAAMPEESIKIMADLYSNLGFMAGAEGKLKKLSILENLSFSTYIGFSKTLFPISGNGVATGAYSSYSVRNKQYSDSGWLLGTEFPFRFMSTFKASMTFPLVKLSIDIPVFSDPYFQSDFISGRQEDMNWIDFMLNNPLLASSGSTSSGSSVSSFSWQISGSVSKPDFVKSLEPYLKELSISSFSSTLQFALKTDSTLSSEIKNYSPNRQFFYPSSIVPLKVSASASGTIYSYSSKDSSSQTSADQIRAEDREDAEKSILNTEVTAKEIAQIALVPDELIPPEQTEQNSTETGQVKAAGSAEETDDSGLSLPDALTASNSGKTQIGNLSYSLTYSASPALASEIAYDPSRIATPKDIGSNTVKSTFFSFKTPITLKSAGSWKNDFFSLTNTMTFQPEVQTHPYVSTDSYPKGSSSRSQLLTTDYKSSKFDIKLDNTFSFKPFVFIPAFAGSSLSWNSSFKILSNTFVGTADNPDWIYKFFDGSKDTVSSHNMTLTLSGSQMSKKFEESLSIKINLPPLTESVSGTLSLKMPYLNSLQFSTGFKRKNADSDQWISEPFSQSASLKLFDNKLSLSQSFKYNLEEKHSDSLSFSLKGFDTSLSFSFQYTKPYTLEKGRGWIAADKQQFLPYDVQLSYTMPSQTYYALSRSLSFTPSLSTSLKMDLIRATNTNLNFSAGLKFKLLDLLDISVTSNSTNKVMYRYIQSLTGSSINIPGEQNIFVDLFQSFNFFNESARKSSGFKLDTFEIKLSHDLHDWTLSANYKVSPRLITTSQPYYYDFSPYFSLSVTWKPMSSIKTSIVDKYGELVLNPD